MKILLAIDGPRYSLAATRYLCAHLAHPARQVDIVHVADVPEPAVPSGMESADRRQLLRQLGQAAWRWARAAKSLLARPGVRPQARMVRRRPAPTIVEEAERSSASLIVLGSRGVRSPSGASRCGRASRTVFRSDRGVGTA